MSPESQIISQNISMLLTQGRSAEARIELERLLSLDPEDPEARSLAGDVYAFTGAYGAAYKHYNAAAETYNRLGRADMALAVHHKILELDPSQLDAPTQARVRLLQLLVFAEDAIVSGHNDKAVSGFTEAIRQFPNHTITYQRLANLLVRMGRVEEALGHYLTVAEAFFAHGVHPKARPYFERVLELKPAHGSALERLQACLSAEGREAEAQRFVKAAVLALLKQGESAQAAVLHAKLPQDQQGPSALSAALLLQTGKIEEAAQMASKLETARPELAEWFRGLAKAAQERADVPIAEAYGRWAQGDFSPPQPQAEPKPEETAPVLRPQAAPVDEGSPLEAQGVPAPEDRIVLQTMGEMCLAEEMFEEAKQVFERLLSADPNHQGYWEDLNRARAGLGLPPQFPGSHAPQSVLAPPRPPAPPVPPAAVLAPETEAKIAPPPPPLPPPIAEIPVAKPELILAPPAPIPVAPPVPAPVVEAPAPVLPPLVEAAAPAPPALAAPAPETVPALPPLPPVKAQLQRPELEPMGRHGSAAPKEAKSAAQRPAVEWADAPFAVGPSGEAKAKPSIKAPEALAPLKPLAKTLTPPPPLATPRITRHQFVTVLGELPPAVSSEVDDSDELIA